MSYDTLSVVMSYDCPPGQVMSYDTLRVVMSYLSKKRGKTDFFQRLK